MYMDMHVYEYTYASYVVTLMEPHNYSNGTITQHKYRKDTVSSLPVVNRVKSLNTLLYGYRQHSGFYPVQVVMTQV